MYKAIISDLSRTLITAKDKEYTGKINALHESLKIKGYYDFWDVFEMREDLLSFYENLLKKMDVYIFTVGYIQEYPPLKEKLGNVFKDIFSARRLGLNGKKDPESYRFICDKINVKPNEIIYVDDNEKNLVAAKEAGMTVIRFETEEQVIGDVGELLGDR